MSICLFMKVFVAGFRGDAPIYAPCTPPSQKIVPRSHLGVVLKQRKSGRLLRLEVFSLGRTVLREFVRWLRVVNLCLRSLGDDPGPFINQGLALLANCKIKVNQGCTA